METHKKEYITIINGFVAMIFSETIASFDATIINKAANNINIPATTGNTILETL